MRLSHLLEPAAAAALTLFAMLGFAQAEGTQRDSCTDDAMIVFDASGSMSGNEKLGIATTVTRIDEVRSALGKVLPAAARYRRVGLITYGPGPYNQCNVELNLRPAVDATKRIMEAVEALTPAGKTPLTAAVERAAEVLDYRRKPGVVVVLTDGEETCGGSPCHLGKQLQNAQLTIHVIAYRTSYFSWTGEESVLGIKCLAEESNGLYVTADSQEELVSAFRETLSCPMISEMRP
ncbi:MAG TPA: vWA domain-containing protein [Methyloceanibacter sp.]|nr:vWA domain-containing protein [Methyloceanibacter sp.]